MQTHSPELYTQYLASIIIVLLMIGSIIVILLLYQEKKRIQKVEVQNLKTKFEKELIQTRFEIQESVLKNISMELHDNIGQIMLLTNVNLTILQSFPQEAGSNELIIDTKKLISRATEDISQLSRSINSDRITEIGVFAAIAHELDLMRRKDLFKIGFTNTLDESGSNLPAEVQLLVFRMFQEIFNNIIKHSYATQVTVAITANSYQEYSIRISDNGKGFSVPQDKNNNSYNGLGLRSLSSRADLFGGKLEVNSILHEGTTISIFIPVQHEPI